MKKIFLIILILISIYLYKNSTKGKYTYTIEIEDKNAEALVIIVNIEQNKKEIQQIRYQSEFDYEWYKMYTSNNGEIVRFIDVNFDKELDMVMQYRGAVVNQSYVYAIYEEGEFVLTNQYENITNPVFLNELILSTNYTLGIPTYELYDKNLNKIAEIIATIGEEIIYTQTIYGNIKNKKLTLLSNPEINRIDTKQQIANIFDGFDIEMYGID